MLINMSAYNKSDASNEPLVVQQFDISIEDAKKEPVQISFHDEQAKVVVEKEGSEMDATSQMLYLHCLVGTCPIQRYEKHGSGWFVT